MNYKKLLITVFLVLVLLISATGCKKSGLRTGPAAQKKCPTSYMLMGTECCLDQNANKVCDRDEQNTGIGSGLPSLGILTPKIGSGTTSTQTPTPTPPGGYTPPTTQPSYIPYKSTDFNANIPKDWPVAEESSDQGTMVAVGSEEIGVAIVVMVIYSPEPITLNQLTTAYEAEFGSTLVESKPTTLSGKPAHEMTIMDSGNEVTMIYAVEDDVMHSIMYAIEEDSRKTYNQGVVDDFVNSYQITESTNTPTQSLILTPSQETQEASVLDPAIECLYNTDCNNGVGYKCEFHKCIAGTTTTVTPPATPSGPSLEFGSIVKLTDFTDGNKREYASISGNGQKIIYKTFLPKEPGAHGGHWTLWVTDTAGSKQQTKVFDTGLGAANRLGSLMHSPTLDYNAEYAYFAYERRLNPKSGWADEVGVGRVKLSDKQFTGINLDISGYQKVDLGNFFVTNSKIYVSTRMWVVAEGVDPRDRADAHGLMRMNLDGSNQETLKIFNPANGDASPYYDSKLFVEGDKIYYKAYGGYYAFNINTKQVSKLHEKVQEYGIIALDNGKLFSNRYSNVYYYDANTNTFQENIGGSVMQQRGVKNGIIYSSCYNGISYSCDGSFRIMDLQGNKKTIITKDTPQATNKLSWEYQFGGYSGSQISGDGKKVILTNFYKTGTKNYYVLNLK